MSEIVLVASRGANLFMRELLELLAAELADAGVGARVAFDRFPDDPDARYVVVPHEFYDTRPEADWPTRDQLARTVALATEQPGSHWFDRAVALAEPCGAILDISEVGRVELARRGLRAGRLQLGYSHHWDRWGGGAAERSVDIAYMASANRRRDVHLASYADVLAARDAELVIGPIAPKLAHGPGFVAGDAKRELLASARIALSIRSQIPPYFEWVRAIEAISNGAVLVTEQGAGHAPLVPGEHFVSGRPESLALLAEGLLRDPDRLEAIRRRAYEHLREAVPLRPGVLALADAAFGLPAGAPATPAAEAPPAPAPPAPSPGRFEPRAPDLVDAVAEPAPPPSASAARIRRVTLDAIAARRRAEAQLAREQGRDPAAIETVHETPAWAGAEPRVTVAIPCYRHGAEAAEAVASAAAQTLWPLEVLVLDDGSDDDSAAAVGAALAARPWLPARLLRRALNAGLAPARNALLNVARAPFVLMLDADNLLYPRAAERLVAALEDDQGAAFAYGILAVDANDRPDGLLSYRDWDPRLLRDDNPVDALALLRAEPIRALGGYLEDDELYGWEDYELWCRVAAGGGHGAHVRNVVARYRRSGESMVTLADLDQDSMRAALRRRHPALFAGDASRTLIEP